MLLHRGSTNECVLLFQRSMKNHSFSFQSSSGEQLLGVHYDGARGRESVGDGQGQLWVAVDYANGILPVAWTTKEGVNQCQQKFDRLVTLLSS